MLRVRAALMLCNKFPVDVEESVAVSVSVFVFVFVAVLLRVLVMVLLPNEKPPVEPFVKVMPLPALAAASGLTRSIKHSVIDKKVVGFFILSPEIIKLLHNLDGTDVDDRIHQARVAVNI